MYFKTKFELVDVLFTFRVPSPSEVPLFVLPSILSAKAFLSLAQDYKRLSTHSRTNSRIRISRRIKHSQRTEPIRNITSRTTAIKSNSSSCCRP